MAAPHGQQMQALRKVLRRLKRYRLLLALSILFAAVTVALTLYVPVLVGEAIDLILGPGQVDFTGIAALLVRIACSYGFRGLFGNMVVAYAEAFSWIFLLGILAWRYWRKRFGSR